MTEDGSSRSAQQSSTFTVESASYQDTFQESVIRNVIAGGVARICSATLLHPLDVAKTRMQFQRRGHTQGVFYRHGAHALLHTLTTEGPFALYRGLFIRLFYVVPSAAINFTIYDQLKTSLFGEGSWNNVVYTVILGGLSRIVQTGVRTPFDVVKQQMQVQGMEGAKSHVAAFRLGNTRDTIKSIGKPRGFWSGYGVTIIRDIGFAACYFGSYEVFQRVIHLMSGENDQQKFFKFGIAGGAAGAFSTFALQPIDVIKTRLQTQAQLPESERHYSSAKDVIRYILKYEDFRSFWRGCGVRTLQTMPAAAITFTTFEFMKAKLNNFVVLDSLEAQFNKMFK